MYESNVTYRNRMNVGYTFLKLNEREYLFQISAEDNGYWRFGGKDNEPSVNMDDLGYFDPSGGPFVARGVEVDGRSVERIRSTPEGMILEIETLNEVAHDAER